MSTRMKLTVSRSRISSSSAPGRQGPVHVQPTPSAHAVSNVQYSKRNAAVALMLAASMVGYAKNL